jgi:hypothetical protein
MLTGTVNVGVAGVDYPAPPYPGITYVVPCGSEKLDRPAPAGELYRGSMFRHTFDNVSRLAALDEQEGRGPARVLILSALYGLVDPDTVIEPYDLRMGAPGSISPEALTGQAVAFGIDWGSQVYALLPKAYLAQLDRALREIYVYVQDVYEGCGGIGEQRRVNAHVGRPTMKPQLPTGPGPTVWMGAGVYAFWWGEPILVSYGRLRPMKGSLPVATAPWVLDSRGFNEISEHGRWTIPAGEYAADVERYADQIGHLEWVAPQDWPASAALLARTGLTEAEHQRRTIESVLTLRQMLPDRTVIAVVTGETAAGYLRHVEMYRRAGLDLTSEPHVVGVGALVGRRPREAAEIVRLLHLAGLRRMHGFGIKTKVLDLVGHLFESVDSACWSSEARRRGGRCPHGIVEWEQNCPRAARAWCDEQRRRAAAAVVQDALSASGSEPNVSLWADGLF